MSNIKPFLAPLKRLSLQILLLLGCYFISRCCFTLINAATFKGLSFPGFLRLCFYAIRYDLSAIFAVNLPYIILLLVPLPIWKWKGYERFTQVIFIGCNILAFLFELSDWAYFPYNFKRATSDVLHMVSRQGDFWNVLPGYLVSYWYLPLAVVTVYHWPGKDQSAHLQGYTPGRTAAYEYMDIRPPAINKTGHRNRHPCYRDPRGLQYIPIGLRNAVQVTDSRYVPVVLNTPFSIITSYATPALTEVYYMPQDKAATIIPTLKNYKGEPFRNKNVVVIILESFSKEFTKLGGHKSYTRSLIALWTNRSFAHRLMRMPRHPQTEYRVSSQAFHPSCRKPSRPLITAQTELMPCRAIEKRRLQYFILPWRHQWHHELRHLCFGCRLRSYYGRKEYANEKDYDGNWGIWDEPFLQYFARGLNEKQQPFMASVFTLSSHPPYALPEQYKGKLPSGPKPCLCHDLLFG